MKTYSIRRTSFCNKRIEKFKKQLLERKPKFNDLREYLRKKFGDNKYSYEEFVELEKKFKKRHSNYISTFNYTVKRMIENRFKKVSDLYISRTMKIIKQEHILQLRAIMKSDLEIVDYCNYYEIRTKKDDLMIYSPLRYVKRIYDSYYCNEKKYIKNFESKIKEFVKTYFKSKEEYIFECLMFEISFLHEYSIFGKELEMLGKIIGFSNRKQFQIIVNSMNSIHRNKFYSFQFDKLSTKFRDLLINSLTSGKMNLNGSANKTIIEIIKHIDLSYEEKKQIIFAYANQCSYVIAGKRTLESYNLPFKNILKEEDWEHLINEVIFIGDNSIRIEFKK